MEQRKRRGQPREGEREREAGRRGDRTERDEGSDCAVPHTLEAQSPLETVAALDHGMTVQQ